jgi:hypothetical protein
MATYVGSTEVGEFDGRGGWSAVSLVDTSTPVRLDGQGTDRISGSCSQTPALGVVLARWEDFFTAKLGG